MRKFAKNVVKKLPIISRLITVRDELLEERDRLASHLVARDELLAERDRLLSDLAALRKGWDEVKAAFSAVSGNPRWAPPGHFYSPIPSISEIRRDESKIFGTVPRQIAGVDLREAEQLKLLNDLAGCYEMGMPFKPEKTIGLRYYYENPAYSYGDAILSHCMIRHLKPKRILEIGSGFSSCMILDTNELFFGGTIATTLIEPHPELLRSLIRDTDERAIRIVPIRLQDVDLSEFDALQENDILFIDSTHVSKINSDVNRIFFEILPRLASGVYVHFHDIVFPFEYPMEWVYEGRAWNEAYLLRAFLQYNSAFRVVLMNTFMHQFHEAFFQREMPLCLKNPGASIWIRRQ